MDIINLLPEILICVYAIFILLGDLILPAKRKDVLGLFGLIGVVLVFYLICNTSFATAFPFSGFVIDSFSIFFKLLVLFATAVVILLSFDYGPLEIKRKGAYYALILFSCAAMMFLVSATDLIMIYLSIEFLGLCSYVLVGYIRKDIKSIEGSVKYFLLGIFSGAIMVYGMSLIYGLTGSLDLNGIKAWVNGGAKGHLLLATASFFILVGFGFKIAMVPFHMWAPDAYEGAPTPITAYLSTASKAAGLAVLLRVFFTSIPISFNLIAILSAITITVANLVAIPQKNIKRLLAYSSISHVGYILIGFVSNDLIGMEGMLIYILSYLFMNLGAFAIVIAISNKIGSDEIDDYAGISKQAPFLSALLVVFLLSLAGIPPMAGFIGKFYVFSAAIKSGFVWLAIIGILNSVVALYYYFRIVHRMYFVSTEKETEFQVSFPLKLLLTGLGLIVLIIGIFPQYFIEFIQYTNNILK